MKTIGDNIVRVNSMKEAEQQIRTFAKNGIGHKPLFWRGIAYTNEENKGKVLWALVTEGLIREKPNCVVIVDDRINNIIDVQKSVREIWKNTEFLGILYSAPDNTTRISQEKLTATLVETMKLHKNDF
jgi:hypothetical protein